MGSGYGKRLQELYCACDIGERSLSQDGTRLVLWDNTSLHVYNVTVKGLDDIGVIR